MSVRILSLLLGISVLAIAALHYNSLNYFGFPDGSRTELERALLPLYRAFIGLSIAGAAYLFYLAAWRAPARYNLVTVALIYLGLFAVRLAIGYYLSTQLDHGQGG
jgi:membrane protease YdiL (CAAX protease family)